jgi:chromatin remodeling complex protein RSC6
MMIKSKRLMCEITPQLAEFMGEPVNKKMSRTEITRKIDAYIQDNNLQDVMNPTNIYPDHKLTALILSTFTTSPLKPYPKMITFEMLRDIISNHCIFPQYEDYYYIDSQNNNNISTRPCHLHCYRHIRINRNYQDFWFLCAFTLLFIIVPFVIIR